MKERLIVFDMDGTLYDLKDVVKMSYDMQVCFLSTKMNISQEKAISILADNNIYPVMRKESKSATEFFLRQGLDKEEWAEYREKHFDILQICPQKAVSETLIKKFAEYGKLVLLSSNAYHIIINVLGHISISPKLFSSIMCSDKFPSEEKFNKKSAMQIILEDTKKAPELLLSIGDRFETDIAPALELGGEGILLNSPQSLEAVYKDLSKDNLHTNNKYEYLKN